VTTIPIQCPLLQPAEKEQGSKMTTRSNRPLSQSGEHGKTGIKELFDKLTHALLLRVIMLNNNTKILLVSFVRHIEL